MLKPRSSGTPGPAYGARRLETEPGNHAGTAPAVAKKGANMAETSSDILAELRAREGNTGVSVPAPAPPALVRTSHWVSLDNYGQAQELKCCLTYSTTWRGADCLVVMELAQRRMTRWNRDANGPTAESWQPWTCYASSANEVDERSAADPSMVRSGKGLTELARRRLSEVLEPIAREYLDTAELLEGRRAGTLKAIDPERHQSHHTTATSIVRDLRAGLRHNAEWLTAEDLERGEALAAGYEAVEALRVGFLDGAD